MELDGLENLREVPHFILPEIDESLMRAMAAGARPPLRYLGAGMFGIVYGDHWGRAWKVARIGDVSAAPKGRLFMLDEIGSEYEWLRAAAQSEISRHVPEAYAIYPDQIVLEREFVEGYEGTWADDRRLMDLHKTIEAAMLPRGWTAPEFKENSYIIKPDNTPVLVDVGMAMRVGMNLTGYVEAVLGGLPSHENWRDLAFALLSEMRQKTVPEGVAKELISRLIEKDPEIRRGFSIPW